MKCQISKKKNSIIESPGVFLIKINMFLLKNINVSIMNFLIIEKYFKKIVILLVIYNCLKELTFSTPVYDI